jgi:hypothetical protein
MSSFSFESSYKFTDEFMCRLNEIKKKYSHLNFSQINPEET